MFIFVLGLLLLFVSKLMSNTALDNHNIFAKKDVYTLGSVCT